MNKRVKKLFTYGAIAAYALAIAIFAVWWIS